MREYPRIQPSAHPPPARRPVRPRISIDWRRGARLLVAGAEPAAVAAELGISEEHFWHHLRRSARFRARIREALAQRRLAVELRLRLQAHLQAPLPPLG